MSTRATKSGVARDFYAKVLDKFDERQANEALEWMKNQIQEDFDTNGNIDNFVNQLRDGVRLCKLMNSIQPNSIKKINENRTYGVPESELFQTPDLWDYQNPYQVVICIFALGRKVSKNGGDGIGPKEAEANPREFSKQKIEEGKKFIGLQMGYNKGASQSGMSFGRFRQIKEDNPDGSV
ncbi:hypothetical protein SNEBB_002039 [Seison nebaliae]|nr:hypothetical protein SNEBB_002039 [Seison nebaliae]